jgi:AcrR family transcriptional regulator
MLMVCQCGMYADRMPRLTRAENRARTRRLLMTTARELFLRDGYHATSLEKIAETAGFSKGAFYHNFAGKDEICLHVLDEIRAEHAAQIVAILREPVQERLGSLERWAQKVIGDPQWTRLELEYAVRAQSSNVREEIRTRVDALSSGICAMVARLARDAGTQPELPPHEIGISLLAMGVGLGLFRAADPTLPVTPVINAMRLIAGLPAAPDSLPPVN